MMDVDHVVRSSSRHRRLCFFSEDMRNNVGGEGEGDQMVCFLWQANNFWTYRERARSGKYFGCQYPLLTYLHIFCIPIIDRFKRILQRLCLSM